MTENFLTIPAAPNYEINRRLVCRNKKTGYVLKRHKDKNGRDYYSMRTNDGKIYCRSPKFLRRVARVAANEDTFEPIPSLGYRYEINPRGVIRNARTKQILKTKRNGKCIALQIGTGKYFCRAIADLLWEVHGQIFLPRYRRLALGSTRANHQASLSPATMLGGKSPRQIFLPDDERLRPLPCPKTFP